MQLSGQLSVHVSGQLHACALAAVQLTAAQTYACAWTARPGSYISISHNIM